MLKDITLGQYFPGNSIIHRLDPRAKIIIAISYILGIFLAKRVFAFAFMTLSCIFIILISRISINVILKGLTPIIYILVFSMVLNMFWMKGEGEPLISFWRIQIFKEGI